MFCLQFESILVLCQLFSVHACHPALRSNNVGRLKPSVKDFNEGVIYCKQPHLSKVMAREISLAQLRSVALNKHAFFLRLQHHLFFRTCMSVILS